MPTSLPALVAAKKSLTSAPTWVERGPMGLELTAPLEIDGVVIEGLSLRGRARKPLQDRELIFQLEYRHAQIAGGPCCRIEWRPLSAHNNKALGPRQFRHVLLTGSHHHPFDLNSAHSKEAVLRGELPIAIPINDDPKNYRALLGLVGKEFNIAAIQQI